MSFNGQKQALAVARTLAGTGIAIADMNGPAGMGPTVAVLIVSASGLPPSDGTISIQIFPSGHIAVGTDINGNIGATATFVNGGDDINYSIAGGGFVAFAKGYWASSVRAVITGGGVAGVVDFTVQFSSLDPNDNTDFPPPPTLTETPSNTQVNNQVYNPTTQEQKANITFQFNNSAADNPNGFVVNQIDNLGNITPVGSTPFVAGQTAYTIPISAFNVLGVTYTYEVASYKYGAPNLFSNWSTQLLVNWDNPNIQITSTWAFTLSGTAPLILIADASGIYQLTIGKTNDTVYVRVGSTQTIDFAIPDPFVDLGYIGG